MMSPDPLKSAISINVDDTSLAIPSLNQCRSSQQRVLEQVQTIKRTRSRKSSHGSGSVTLTPTSPLNDNVFTFKSPPVLNGSASIGNGLSRTLAGNWQIVNGGTKMNTIRSNHYSVKGSGAKMNTITSNHHYGRGQSLGSRTAVGRANTSRSEPDLGRGLTKPKCAAPSQKKSAGGVVMDINMRKAVAFLSSADETLQHCGASFIQRSTFIDAKAKEEVFQLKGIPPLVGLLRSLSFKIHRTASAALRNLTFKNGNNKEQVVHHGGLQEAVALLRRSESPEIHKQLTGLLWNLSSVESLRPDLVKIALPALMEKVILPCATGPDCTNNNNMDPEAFFHATGCLRNFSSGKPSVRQTMRKCRGLVDSLVGYIEDCLEAGRPDDKSVENCVCVLHNLTFQLEAEAPALFSRITALARASDNTHKGRDNGPIGCFSPQSSKVLQQEQHFDYPTVEDQHPTGAGWLIHSRALQGYLSLLGSSQRDDTLEASCGTLQNLTAHPGIVSNVISQTIVKRLNGLQVIAPLLKSPKVNLQWNTVALVANLAQSQHLQSSIARSGLSELLDILKSGTKEGNESDDTLSVACQTAHLLLMEEQEFGKHLLTDSLVDSLNDLSQHRYLPKSSKAASLFLYNLWSEKETQSFLKKKGMNKAFFVNDITTAAQRSVQVIE